MAEKRTPDQVERVLMLRAQGLPMTQISRLTGIPATTVHRWCQHVPGYVASPEESPLPCWRCNGTSPTSAWRKAYAYLLGQYLGDGCIDRARRGVLKLGVYGDTRYVDITGETVAAMRTVSGNSVNVQPRTGCSMVYAYSTHWRCLFPQMGPGRKSERLIHLEPWQERIVREYPRQLIRGLIHSDGCRATNNVRGAAGGQYSYPRYFFSNNSLDIQRIFTGALDQLGIPWRNSRWNVVSIARREGVAALDEFVGPKS